MTRKKINAIVDHFKTVAGAKEIKRCFLFTFWILTSTIYGQSKSKDSVKTIEIKEVVLTNSTKRDVAGITTSALVNSETLETFSPLNATNAINQIPGVYALSGALNTNRITIRGIGSRTPFGTDKLRLYYNDIPVTNGAGSSTIETFDLENLESMEIIKGPQGSSYGANLGGAILLKSKANSVEGTKASNNFTFGSYNLIKNNIAVKHKADKFYMGVSYNHTDIEGYRENSDFQREGVLIDGGYHINDKNRIGILINHIDYTAQIPSSINQTDFDENPTQAASNWLEAKGYEDNLYTLVGLNYKGRLGEKLENTSSIFYTRLDLYEPRPFNILDESTNGYGFRTRFEGGFNVKNTNVNYTLGAELYKDEYDWVTYDNEFRDNNGNGSLQGAQISDNKEYRNQLNLFGSIVFPITNKLKAQFNLTMNHTSYDFRDLFNAGTEDKSASRSFDPIMLPSISVDYAYNSFSNFYFNVSRGFSNPNLEETLTPDGVINPNIEQEKGMSYEIGSNIKWFDDRLLVNVSLYRMDISDLLVAERVEEDQYIGRNAGKTKHQGIELDISYKMSFLGRSTIKPFVRYALSDHTFVDFVDEDQDFSGNALTGVPRNKVNSGFYWLLDELCWNVNYQFIDDIPLTDGNTIHSSSFSVFNTKIGYKKKIKDKLMLGLNMGINNLFDTKYAQSVLINAVGFGGSEPRYFYPGNDRNYYASFKISYQL